MVKQINEGLTKTVIIDISRIRKLAGLNEAIIDTVPTEANLLKLLKDYNITQETGRFTVQDSQIDLYYLPSDKETRHGREAENLWPEAKKLVDDIRSGKLEHKFSISIFHLAQPGNPFKDIAIRLKFTKIESSAGKSLEVKVPKLLYHITDHKNEQGILAHGLVPQRQNYSIDDKYRFNRAEPGSVHRSYKATHLTGSPMATLRWLGKAQQSNTFLEIDTVKCKQYGVKFYDDINWDAPSRSYVTFDVIPPDCIVKMWRALDFYIPTKRELQTVGVKKI